MAIPIISRLSYWDYERIFLTCLILITEALLRFFMLFIPYSFFRFICSLIPICNRVPHLFKAEESDDSASLLPSVQDSVLMIERHGYLAEEHTAITDDGYFLTLHRIAAPENLAKSRPISSDGKRPIILLMHGCMMSSEVWFCHENPNKCYPLIFADMGYL
jgi:hypothetical protein